jgi:Protein of unknown function (DUF1570)
MSKKFYGRVLSFFCILFSLGAYPAKYSSQAHTDEISSNSSYFPIRKDQGPAVELLTHDCVLNPLMQDKIHRGIQFLHSFYAQYLDYNFTENLAVRIHIFKDADAYRQYIEQTHPHIPKTWIGVYLSGTNEILVSLEKDETAFYRNVFHETSHLLLTDKVKNCPNWINEGLAEYFEYMEVQGEEVFVHPQMAKDDRTKNWHGQGSLPDLLASVSMTNKEWNFNDNLSDSDQPRTLGWSVSYFLMSDAKGKAFIGRLLGYLAQYPNDPQASLRAMNEHYPGGSRKLMQEWQAWIVQKRATHTYVSHYKLDTKTAQVEGGW